jgi:hypothetical protein
MSISLFAPKTLHEKLLMIVTVLLIFLIIIVPSRLVWIKTSTKEIKYFHINRIIFESEYHEAYDFSKDFFTRRNYIRSSFKFPNYDDAKAWFELGHKHLYSFKDKKNKYWGHFELVPLNNDVVNSIIQGEIAEEKDLTKEHIDTSKKASNFYIGDLILINPIKNKDCSDLKPKLTAYAINRLIIMAIKNVIKENKIKKNVCIIAFSETAMGKRCLKKFNFLPAQNGHVFYKSYSMAEIDIVIKNMENETIQIKDELEKALVNYYK